jgi:urease accessory protein
MAAARTGIAMHTATPLTIMPTESDPADSASLARLRLLQLVSPALPIGGFTYSQGLEWAVEQGWVGNHAQLGDWLQGLIDDALALHELPILLRLHRACAAGDEAAIERWGRCLYAGRETRELRQEERQRARALITLLGDLGIERARTWREVLLHCQAAPFALAAVHWSISERDCLLGYAWGWLENQVAAAIKLIPLGQTDGQRVQLALAGQLPQAVGTAFGIGDDGLGAGAPALAIASARHETQYTRLFRS